MAHYAFLDQNNIVTDVIVGIDEDNLIEGKTPEAWYGEFRGQKCVRTSYNATNNGFRKNYAGIGYSYDEERDAFIPPKLFNSWILDENLCQWKPPIEYPNSNDRYIWNEQNMGWVAQEWDSQSQSWVDKI